MSTDAATRVTGAGIVRLHRGDTGHVLLCLPHAGGIADLFRPWGALVGSRADVWAVDYPGRRSATGRLWTTLGDLAGRIVRECAGVETLTVFGHSLGAILAHEVVAQLGAEGVSPHRLVASASPTPARRALGPAGDVTSRAEELLHTGGTPAPVLADAEFHRHALGLLRGDLTVLDAHRPSTERLDVPLVALAGLADGVCPPATVAEWASCSSRFQRVRYFSGGHMFPFERPQPVVEACLQ